MHIVIWTFEVMEGKNRNDLMIPIEGSAADYQDVPELIRCYYGLAPELKPGVEIYLWKSEADADKFFDSDWDGETSRRWESAPMTRQDFDAPVVVETAEKRMVTSR